MKDFSKGNQGCLKAKVPGLAQIDPIAPRLTDAQWRPAMTRLNDEYRDQKNGMIDYDHYRQLAADLRRETRSRLLKAVWTGLAAYFKFPQKRWMRRQASSRSSVFVA